MQHTTWQLAHMADCASPDAHDGIGFDYEEGAQDGSPGADFLRHVEDTVLERLDDCETDEDPDDIAWEVADYCVPIYTHERWRVFVDLAAWDEDPGTYGTPDDMTDAAGVALMEIGRRLASALIEKAHEDEDGEVDA